MPRLHTGRIIVEQITNVDGYLARPDGDIDFMGAAGDFSGSGPTPRRIALKAAANPR